MIVPLDDLYEDGWPVLEWLGEDLEEVAVVVVVDQDLQLLLLGYNCFYYVVTLKLTSATVLQP